MEPAERMNDFQLALKAAVDGKQSEIWTAMPGIVEAYDPATQTVTVQGAIQPQVHDALTGKWVSKTLPLFGKVPVAFPGGGGFTLTFPLKKGDEGIVIFGKNCIDGWWQNGGVQPQIEVRQHDLSDAMFVPGIRSVPKVPTAPAPSSTVPQLRSDDGTLSVSIDKTSGAVTIKAPIKITLDAPLVEITGTFSGINSHGAAIAGTINGPLHTTGNITSDADVIAGGVSGAHHQHTGVQPGGGTSGPPV